MSRLSRNLKRISFGGPSVKSGAASNKAGENKYKGSGLSYMSGGLITINAEQYYGNSLA